MRPSNRTLAFAALLAASLPAGAALAARPGDARSAESAFRDAKAYTVRIQTRIETPFIEDVRGAFQGAGFLVDAARGWIVTNAHVAGCGPADVRVAFADGAFEPAHAVYVDPFADLAVLALDHPVPGRAVARLDRGAAPRVGEAVGAFGHPLGIPFTGTRGIVSGVTHLDGPALLQIDATIDHGNSGGPVLALADGRVVGVATAGAGDDGRDRLNFATPIADAVRILDLLDAGAVPSPPRLGIALLKDVDGYYTLQVARTYDAARWPFEPGDRIVAVAGHAGPMGRLQDLVLALRGRTAPVAVTVERDGAPVVLEVRPELRPELIARRGVLVDGALFAPAELDDAAGTAFDGRLMVHSVDPSSEAMVQGFEPLDALESVDGRAFASVEALEAYLRERPAGPLVVDLVRLSKDRHLVFEIHRRELPGEAVGSVGPVEAPAVATR